MPLILNGSTLLKNTSGGLATTTTCCCGQNPEECFCGVVWCQYEIRLVSPVSLGPVRANPCIGADPDGQNVADLGPTPCSQDILPGSTSIVFSDRSPVGTEESGIYATAATSFNDLFMSYGGAYSYVRTGLRLFCDGDILRISLSITALLYNNPFLFFPSGLLYFAAGAISAPLDFECENTTARQVCDPSSVPSVKNKKLAGTVDVTARIDTTSIGDWSASYTDGITGSLGCVQDVIDNYEVTFRITQRQSCRIVDCNCSTSLDGLKATFEGKEFTLGTEEPYNEFFSGYELVTTHYKDFSGNYVFEKYKVLEFPAGTIGDVQLATVYCETDDEADPPVPRWYVRFESICRQFAPDAETKRTEIGYLPCFESAGCAGRTEGDPLPLGSPIDVEEIEGSPETTDGLDACTPPARADLTIFEDCG